MARRPAHGKGSDPWPCPDNDGHGPGELVGCPPKRHTLGHELEQPGTLGRQVGLARTIVKWRWRRAMEASQA
ncbi:hypothetical protein NL676_038604 [Syzygium grande]|nr:hypothetical protein NL676_038604 [Syzygium grande]